GEALTDDQGRAYRDRRPSDASGEENRRTHHRAALRSYRARHPQRQALLGARLRHLLGAPPSPARGLQPADPESDDDSGRTHRRFPPSAKAEEGSVEGPEIIDKRRSA